ncbi:MAG: YceI family protein [Ktedonobacterales bacterium]
MAWDFDPAHTSIEFSAKHMMVSTVRGHFNKFSGKLELDEPNHADSQVEFTIEAASLTTGDENRDNHLRSPDFLNVAEFPTIAFKSTQVEKLDDDHARVTGDLTIRDVTKPLVLEVTREGESKNRRGERLLGYSVRGSLNRKDWDLNWNVALETGGVVVSDKINIQIDAEVFEPAVAVAPQA